MTTRHVTRDGGWAGYQGITGDGAAASPAATDLIALLDAVEVPVVVVRRDFTIACFNRAADALGLSASDVGRTCHDISALAGLPDLEQRCGQVIADGVEFRADVRDGGKWLAVRISPYMKSDRQVIGAVLTFTNVTAFRASIDQAIYEREFTKAILNTVADPLLVLSADQRIQSGNRAFYTTFGVSRDETHGVTLYELGNGAFDLAPLRAQLTEIFAGGRAFRPVEVDYVVPGQGRRTLALDARPLSLPGHSERRVLVTFQDVTARKRAEQARRESEREWRLIVNTIPGLVALLAATGEVEVVNRQLLEYFGQTLEELRQWGTNGTVHPEDLPHVADVFSRSIASGSPYQIVQRFRRSDGVYRWFENSGYPVHDATGRVTRWCVLLTDIDERKRAEDALRESERESRLIVDSIPGMVAVFTPAGELEFVNRQIIEYFGRTLEELRRWGSDDTTHPDDRPRIVELFTRAVASGQPFDWESRARRFDGVYRWHRTRGFPLRDAGGHIVRWYNLIVDIDERKRAEEALAASERNLQLIIDTIPALAWSARTDGSAEFFSQHYLDYMGLSAEQAKDRGWTAAVHPDDLSGLAATWQRIMSSEAPGEAEARLRRHDGEYRWFLFRANPLRDETGRVVKWYGVNADIEDRKRAEAELRRTYTYLAEAQRLSRCGSFFSDFTTDERIWSDELYRILEIDPTTRVTGQLFRSMVHPEDLPLYDAEFARLAAGHNLETAFRIVTARGAVKHLRSVCHIVDWKNGRPVCFGAVQDVTETVVAEEALNRARSELAHVARVTTLGALTASIAHEVNQPLSGIITNASTCLRMLDADPPNLDGARETARRTIRDGHRASDVVARLRALFSKKEFTLEAMDLNEATREVIALSSSDLQRDRVVLRSELADDLPPVVGDRVQLQQVILNLLLNAAEATREVDDRAREVTIRTEREDDARVRVTVRDTGVGLDDQSMGKVFDAFYTTKSGGMGIGLSVSRSIVDRHGGRLWAEPNDGPGATFAFSIPCRRAGGEDGVPVTSGS
jgi:PAS domain S-box-containing protein